MTTRNVNRGIGLAVLLACLGPCMAWAAEAPRSLSLLFLGDNGHHQPVVRFKQLQPVMASRGIKLTYSDVPDDLNPDTLAKYDGLVLYANIDEIKPEQAKALLDFVAKGRGFVPLHCASFCFRNNADVVALMGAQFQRHGTGTFRTQIASSEHPVMRGFRGFESWDETYVHTKHNEKDRTVLEFRQEGESREPWTWVRTHGKGRVFYTAWGHDARTWGNPGFHNLVERGIRWACGDDASVVPDFADRPEMTPKRTDVKPFEYVDANIPFYPPNRGAGSEAPRRMPEPLPPEESIKHFVTPRSFEVRLFASEPDISKPIAMAWDERGRLWLCETVDYPNELQPAGEGNDRIRICEDTDGDGRADKFTLFAEKLSIPTTLAFCRGGVIVQNGRETLYLKDTDGDDRADLRKAIITGWGIGDTHGGVSNFQYGFDGWYWGMHGYNTSEPVIAGGRKVTPFRQGFIRFRVEPDGEAVKVTELEFLRSTSNNTWGVGFSEEGDVFGSTANGNPSVHLPLPNRYYEQVRGWSVSQLGGIAESNRFEPITENVRQVDFHGGFTAAAGHALYTARAWPREYWNRTAFVCEPTGHLVATFVITPDGAGFRSKNSWNILASDDEWSAPIMAEVGPDGQLWVLDWYNYIVQHNPTPAGFKTGKGNAYETELRDKRHGRVYRVVHTGRAVGPTGEVEPKSESVVKQQSATTLRTAGENQLLAATRSDNLLWRRHAQRLISERYPPGEVPDLVVVALGSTAAREQKVDEIGLNVTAIQNLHELRVLGQLDGANATANKLLIEALAHPSAAVRRTVVTVLPRTSLATDVIRDRKLLFDADPRMRLAALLTLAEAPPSDATGQLLWSACFAMVGSDPVLYDAVVAASARHDVGFLMAAAGDEAGQPNESLDRVVEIVAGHFAREPRADSIRPLIERLGKHTSRNAAALVTGLSRGWPKSTELKWSEADDPSLVAAFHRLPATSRGTLLQLASRWGSKALDSQVAEIARELLATVSDEKAGDADRIAAARQLVELRAGDAESAVSLLQWITPRSSTELAIGLLNAAGQNDAPMVGKNLVLQLPTMTPTVRGVAQRQLMSRVEWTKALLDGIETGKVPVADLSLDQKQALASHPDKAIAERAKPMLASRGGLPNPDRQNVVDDLLPLTKVTGDAEAGKEVFKKQCAKCHTHSGEGTKIGPDLTGMAVHPKHELLTHIIDPSRSVEGNYRIYTVVLEDGRILTGLLASESRTALEIVDVEGKKHSVQRDEVEELKSSTKSLMPDGFEKQVSRDDIANLLEFLTQRGKYLPIPIANVATIVSTKEMFHEGVHDEQKLIFADWGPKVFDKIPFVLIDPQGDRVPNVIMLHGTNGDKPPRMPKSVSLPCNAPAAKIHFLGGISGWGAPASRDGTPTVTIRLKYADGATEDHVTRNGEVWADYIHRVDVPGSRFAFAVRSQQVRYFSIIPGKKTPIGSIELIKGEDVTSPILFAVTVESP